MFNKDNIITKTFFKQKKYFDIFKTIQSIQTIALGGKPIERNCVM